jgi:hypothetical protein
MSPVCLHRRTSVATLRDLREPVARGRPVFRRGYGLRGQKKVGFASDGEAAQRVGTRLDRQIRGAGHQGHRFGSQLSATGKEALLEYLKIL